MALNTLYNCETVSSQVIIQFMKEENARVNSQFKQLEADIKQLKNKPFAYQCAYQHHWDAADSVITYDSLTYDEISVDNGGLDIDYGDFLVGDGLSGVWAVTYTIKSRQDSGERNQAWLFLNGEKIEESNHRTYYTGSDGRVGSLGSRSLYIRLETDDTIDLRTGRLDGSLYDITFCLELVRADD